MHRYWHCFEKYKKQEGFVFSLFFFQTSDKIKWTQLEIKENNFNMKKIYYFKIKDKNTKKFIFFEPQQEISFSETFTKIFSNSLELYLWGFECFKRMNKLFCKWNPFLFFFIDNFLKYLFHTHLKIYLRKKILLNILF